MAFYSLADGVSFGNVGGLPVFLDLGRDRYFRLDAQASETFSHLLRDRASPGRPGDGFEKLVETGLLKHAAEPAAIEPASSFIPEGSVLDQPLNRQPFNPAKLAEIWIGLAQAKRQLGQGGLRRMIDDYRTCKRAMIGASLSSGTDSLVGHFIAARRIIPVAPNCLSDSLALARFLARRRLFPSLVFGVKLAPFGAHCWLQTRSKILNDAADRVREFTPVLVV